MLELSDAEKRGIAKKKAINKAASYFSDDDSLFEFESFEIEDINKDTSADSDKDAHVGATESTYETQPEAKTDGGEQKLNGEGVTYTGANATDKADKGEQTPSDTDAGVTCSGASASEENEADTDSADTQGDVTYTESADSEKTDATDQNKNDRADTETEYSDSTYDESTDSETKESGNADNDVNTETVSENSDTEENNAESNYAEETYATGEDNKAAQYEDTALYSDTEKDTDGQEDLSAEQTDEEDDEIGWPTFYSAVNVSDERSRVYDKSSAEDTDNGKDVSDTSDVKNTLSSHEITKTEGSSKTSDSRGYGNQPLSYGGEYTSVNVEGQLHFDGTEPDFLTESRGAGTSVGTVNEEVEGDLLDEADLDNEIWDRAGKEEWEKHESFLSYCRSLTLPQVSASSYTAPEPESKKAKPTSSGYRYAESERIPVFSDGLNGGTDKAGYAERERRYCENRKAKKDLFLREKSRSCQRTVLYTVLILLTAFLLEILNLAVSGQAVLFGSIELGLTVLAAAFVLGAMYDGLKYAARGTFIPELMTFITVLLSLVYTSVNVFSQTAAESTVLIGLPAIFAVFLTAVYRSLMARREKKAFDITSDYGYYCTEVRMASFRGSPEEVAFGGYAEDGSTLYKTNRIVRADRGFNAQPVRDECYGLIKILLICTVCAAIAAGIAFGFIKRDFYFGLFCAYVLASATCPISIFLSLSLPRHTVAQDVAEDGAAITEFDEESDELDENVIMLGEEELFPAESIRIIDAYWKKSHFLEAHLSKAAAAFNKAGGLLSGLFSGIDLPETSYRETVITDISDGGITVKVDDSLVRAGTDDYLEKHGIEIERYHDIPQKDTRVLYVANNGEFFSRIVIKFVPDTGICRKISELRQSSTLFSLKTSNPCIDSALVFYTTGLEPELLRVVKYMVGDTPSRTDTDREGILISRTGAFGLLSALLGYKRQKRLVLFGIRLAGASGLIGLALALSVSLIGVKWRFISFAILGFHALMTAVAALIGLSGKKQRRKNEKT